MAYNGEPDINQEKELNQALTNLLELMEMDQERNFVTNAELLDQLLSTFSAQLSNYLIPTQVDDEYAGVHIGKLYEDSDFRLMLKSFRNNQILDPFYVLKIIKDAQEILITKPNIQECQVDDSFQHDGCMIVGDLHGNFHDFAHLVRKYDIPGLKYQFIFNGDFIDRGDKQIEVLISLLFLFVMRPNRIFLNRGNHEDITMNTNSNFSPNFMTELRNKYGKYSGCIFDAATKLFAHLPLATIVTNLSNTRLFVVHGGISDTTDLNYIRDKLNRHKYVKIANYCVDPDKFETKQLSDLLWSDPIRKDEITGKYKPKGAKKSTGCYFNEQRGLGSIFGSDVSKNFCEKNGFSYIIRSHEVRETGINQDHPKCFTIFSASYYCNGFNHGAVIEFGARDTKIETYQYRNIGGDQSSRLVRKNHALVQQFKKYLIRTSESILLPKFEQMENEETGRGLIKITEWSRILSEHLHGEITPEQLVLLKDFLCECDVDLVHYKTLFNIYNNSTNNRKNKHDLNYINVITNLFEILDTNNDKLITVDEAEQALKLINKKYGDIYLVKEDCLGFIKQMDKNDDRQIDLDEFKRAFIGDEDLDAGAALSSDSENERHLLSGGETEEDENSDSDISEAGEIRIIRV